MEYVIRREGNEDYLQHWGIKGQKWGVRRFENPDGTLTPEGKKRYYDVKGVGEDRYNGNEKLARKYSNDVRKLEKAYNNADLSKQIKDYAKYKKRAKTASRVGGAALGLAVPAGLANYGTGKYQDVQAFLYNINDASNHNKYLLDSTIERLGYSEDARESTRLLGDLSKGYNTVRNVTFNASKALYDNYDKNEAINAGSRIVRDAAILAAGSAYGVAAYNKIRSSIAKRRLSEKGHEKAVKKAKELTDRFMNTYSGTRYSAMLSKQVEGYKNMHPNTQMSDREILKTLMPLT